MHLISSYVMQNVTGDDDVPRQKACWGPVQKGTAADQPCLSRFHLKAQSHYQRARPASDSYYLRRESDNPSRFLGP